MTVITFKMPYQPMQTINPSVVGGQMNNNSIPVNIFPQQNTFNAIGFNAGFQPQSFDIMSWIRNMFSNFQPMQMPQMPVQNQSFVQPNVQFGMLTSARTTTSSSNNSNITTASTVSVKQSAKVNELISNSNNSQIINPQDAKVSENGLNLLKQFDHVHLTSYKDTGKYYSIGYGHNGPDVKPGDTCTLEEAEATLRKDMEKFTNNIAKQVKVPLTQNQLDALAVFAHNVGNGAFNKSTLLKKLNAGDYVGAANELDKWVHADGKVLKGLVKRRNAEKQLFLKDVKVA
ncbi:MAG: lysozyme [Candidatus Gastranaerophilaceae bacterium]